MLRRWEVGSFRVLGLGCRGLQGKWNISCSKAVCVAHDDHRKNN